MPTTKNEPVRQARPDTSLAALLAPLALFVLGTYLCVSALLWQRGGRLPAGPEDGLSTRLTTAIGESFGLFPILLLGLGLLGLGVWTFLLARRVLLAQCVGAVIALSLGASFLFGVLVSGAGGSAGKMVPGLLPGIAGQVAAIGIALIFLLAGAWVGWSGLDQGVAKKADQQPRGADALKRSHVDDGVSSAEATLLAARPSRPAPHSGAPARPEQDVRLSGGVPQGTRPLPPDHARSESQGSSALSDGPRRAAEAPVRGPEPAREDLAADARHGGGAGAAPVTAPAPRPAAPPGAADLPRPLNTPPPPARELPAWERARAEQARAGAAPEAPDPAGPAAAAGATPFTPSWEQSSLFDLEQGREAPPERSRAAWEDGAGASTASGEWEGTRRAPTPEESQSESEAAGDEAEREAARAALREALRAARAQAADADLEDELGEPRPLAQRETAVQSASAAPVAPIEAAEGTSAGAREPAAPPAPSVDPQAELAAAFAAGLELSEVPKPAESTEAEPPLAASGLTEAFEAAETDEAVGAAPRVIASELGDDELAAAAPVARREAAGAPKLPAELLEEPEFELVDELAEPSSSSAPAPEAEPAAAPAPVQQGTLFEIEPEPEPDPIPVAEAAASASAPARDAEPEPAREEESAGGPFAGLLEQAALPEPKRKRAKRAAPPAAAPAAELGEDDEAADEPEATDELEEAQAPLAAALPEDDASEDEDTEESDEIGEAEPERRIVPVEEPAEASAASAEDSAFELAPAPRKPARAKSSGGERDRLLREAGLLFLDRQRVAVSMLQRQFGLDFKQATELLDELQRRGLIGPYMGGTRRDILLTREQWLASIEAPG